MKLQLKGKLKKVGIILFWVILWSVLTVMVNNKFLLVSPIMTGKRLLELCGSQSFYRSVLGSFSRIAAGFFAGAAAAFLLAYCSAKLKIVEEVLDPFVRFLTAVPVASFAVLLLIWWGSKWLAVGICFLVVFPNLYLSTLEGIRSADKQLLEMAQVFNLTAGSKFFYIYRPALRPFLNSSLKVSLGMCWKSGVAAEVIGVPLHSIGEGLYLSKVWLDTAGVFAWTAVVILLSFFFEKLVLWLGELFFKAEPLCTVKNIAGSSVREFALVQADKSFGEQQVLSRIDFECLPGEVKYLREPSGSGKTTMLRMLAGLEQADAGKVLRPARVSFLFQEDRLCDAYSAVRNVELVTGERQRAREALKLLLPAEELDKPCSQLSGGMRRRVAIVRAMEAESEGVLLDEPFNGLDAENREKVEKYLKEKQQGRPIVIASHI